jgi:hypothetical protein
MVVSGEGMLQQNHKEEASVFQDSKNDGEGRIQQESDRGRVDDLVERVRAQTHTHTEIVCV